MIYTDQWGCTENEVKYKVSRLSFSASSSTSCISQYRVKHRLRMKSFVHSSGHKNLGQGAHTRTSWVILPLLEERCRMMNKAANMQARNIAAFHLPVDGGTPFDRPGSNLPYMPTGIHICFFAMLSLLFYLIGTHSNTRWYNRVEASPGEGHSSARVKEHATALIISRSSCVANARRE